MRMRRTATTAAAAIVLAIVAVLVPGVATALACGASKHASAHVRSGGDRAPLVIGDSVLQGAVREVAAAGYEVDTRGCRQIGEGLRMIAKRRRARTLARFVVLALGANGSIRMRDIRAAMRIAGRDRVLGLVTPRELGGGSGSDARVIRAAGRRFKTRVVVLDWVRASAGRRGWFAGDGLHLGPRGARGMARLLGGAQSLEVGPRVRVGPDRMSKPPLGQGDKMAHARCKGREAAGLHSVL